MKRNLVLILLATVALGVCSNLAAAAKPRVIATTDGEIERAINAVAEVAEIGRERISKAKQPVLVTNA